MEQKYSNNSRISIGRSWLVISANEVVVSIGVCLCVFEQFPDHNSTPNFITKFVYAGHRNN